MGVAQSRAHDVPWQEYEDSAAMRDFFLKTPERAMAFGISVANGNRFPVFIMPMIIEKLKEHLIPDDSNTHFLGKVEHTIGLRKVDIKDVDATVLHDNTKRVLMRVSRINDRGGPRHSVACILEPIDPTTKTRKLLWMDSSSRGSGPDFVAALAEHMRAPITLERPLFEGASLRMQPLSGTCRMWSAMLLIVATLHPESQALARLRAIKTTQELNHQLRMFMFWVHERVMGGRLPAEMIIDYDFDESAEVQDIRDVELQRLDRNDNLDTAYTGSDLLTLLSKGSVPRMIECFFGGSFKEDMFEKVGSDVLDFKVEHYTDNPRCTRCGNYCYDKEVSYCRACRTPFPFPRTAGRWETWTAMAKKANCVEWVGLQFLMACSPNTVGPQAHEAVTSNIQHIRTVGCVYSGITRATLGNDDNQFPWRAARNLFAEWRSDAEMARLTMLVMALMQPGYAQQYVWPKIVYSCEHIAATMGWAFQFENSMRAAIAIQRRVHIRHNDTAVWADPHATAMDDQGAGFSMVHVPDDPDSVCRNNWFAQWAPVWRMLYICMMDHMETLFRADRVGEIPVNDIVDEMSVFVSWIYTSVLGERLPQEIFVLDGTSGTAPADWKSVLNTMIPQNAWSARDELAKVSSGGSADALLKRAAQNNPLGIFGMVCLPGQNLPTIYRDLLIMIDGLCMVPPHHFQTIELPRLVQLASPALYSKLSSLSQG